MRTFNLAIRVVEVDGKVFEPEMQEGDCVRDKYAFLRRANKKADRGREGNGEAEKEIEETSGKLIEKTMQVIKPVATLDTPKPR